MDKSNSFNTNGVGQVPPTEVAPKAKRRRFSASYKLRILNEAEACTQPGEIGAFLRREGLYSSHLAQWRRQRDQGTLHGSTRAGKELFAKDEEITRLRKELKQSRRRLEQAKAVIDGPKKSLCAFWHQQRDRGRAAMKERVTQLRPIVGTTAACRHVGLSRARYYRSRRPAPARPKRRRKSARRLSDAKRAEIRAVLNSERFMDMPPRQIWATLLDEGVYLCHWRTMYRILRENKEIRERRNQRTHPPYTKPELLACAPNELWTWDITTLRGPAKGVYFKLYVILDVFSRYVVGWTLASQESAALAKDLIATTCTRPHVRRDQLKMHADRGPVMVSKTYVQLRADLGVEGSYSRPYRSNDNPYSEAHFRTAKYHRTYEPRFGSLEDARSWARQFFHGYNNEFYHSEIALMHPSTIHYGQTRTVWQARQRVMQEAYEREPERFIRGVPKVPMPRRAVWINRPDEAQAASMIEADRVTRTSRTFVLKPDQVLPA